MLGAFRQSLPNLRDNLLLNKEPAIFHHLAWDYMVFKGEGRRGDQSSPMQNGKMTDCQLIVNQGRGS